MWVIRVFIGAVAALNLQCAILFLAHPEAYAAGFELSGLPGEKIVQGMGILFLMWNIPYLFALANPLEHRVSLLEAVCMQAVGLAGESWLYSTLPAGHAVLRASAVRFIVFDGAGLALLLAALLLATRFRVEHPARAAHEP